MSSTQLDGVTNKQLKLTVTEPLSGHVTFVHAAFNDSCGGTVHSALPLAGLRYGTAVYCIQTIRINNESIL